MTNTTNTKKPFGMRDKIGYMFGDFGNDFTFILSAMFMLKFYTDVMGIEPYVVGLVMMAARFVDAFTDVGMGQIVDRAKSTKYGKFRPWIRRMCGPVAIASFLIFQSGFAGMSYGFKVFWMAFTYILWGSIFYTSINIPYGSMASAISPEPKDRSQLSTWRNIGATLASTVIGVATPLVAYVTVEGKTMLSGSRMTIIAGIFSLCAIVCYLLCFNLVEERVVIADRTDKLNIGKLFGSIFKNRALLGIIAAAICLLLAQLTMSGMAAYVYPNYYGNAKAQSLATLVGTFIMLAICAPTATTLSMKFGKKELSTVACLSATVLYLVCLVVRPASAYSYLVFYGLAYIGLGFFNTVIWAMITDVIDDAEVRNGVREDGTIYAVYSFARKVGQALSSGLTGVLLSAIGYTEATAFEPAVTGKIFSMSCIAPAVGFALVAIALVVIYPLGKQRVESNVQVLKERHNVSK